MKDISVLLLALTLVQLIYCLSKMGRMYQISQRRELGGERDSHGGWNR
jgi:hypothetical protein